MSNPEPEREYVVGRMLPGLSLACRLGADRTYDLVPVGLVPPRTHFQDDHPKSAGMASDIRGWLPALGMRPLELVRAAAVIWGAHIAVTAHGSVGKFMFSFIFLSLARILKTLWAEGAAGLHRRQSHQIADHRSLIAA